MISRIRIDGSGKTAIDCDRALAYAAKRVTGAFTPQASGNYTTSDPVGISVSRGDHVIERDLKEPEDSAFAYRGRLLLYLDLASQEGNS